MNNNDLVQQDELDEIEEELKEQDTEDGKTQLKVSGRSVFELKEIIEKKAQDKKENGKE